MFWLAEDGKLDKEKNLLIQDPFILQKFLEKTWALGRYPPFPIRMSDKETSEVIGGTKDEERKNYYIDIMRDDDAVVFGAIYLDFKLNSNTFSRNARRILHNHIANNPRWGNFEVVVDRLNAPELVNYYEQKRIRYQNWWDIPGYSENNPSPSYVFSANKGDCIYTTEFTVYCLRKAGYSVYGQYINAEADGRKLHAITVYEQDGKMFVMDNGRPYQRGILPYDYFMERYR